MNYKIDLLYRGCLNVLPYTEELNAMNVFPVPDGDTGSNLFHLFSAIKEQYEEYEVDKELLVDTILTYSKGNSGAIFSQFMMSFLSSSDEENQKAFIQAANHAVSETVSSVSEPKEGTVLTAMKSWIQTLQQKKDHGKSILELIQESLDSVKDSVERTKNQMELLAKNNVVDAGAYAFYLFLEGMSSTKIKNNARSASTVRKTIMPDKMIDHGFESVYRFCTEVLIKNVADISEVKQRLQDFGDSISCIGDSKTHRIHLHTNAPDQVLGYLKEEGAIVYQKIDDMQRQFEMRNARKGNIAIVVDSACDIPQKILDHHQIHLLPLQIEVDGMTYLDKVTLTPEIFYDLNETSDQMPKTSQPAIKKIKETYETLLQNYDHVLSVHLSKELSGTYNLCKQVAKDTGDDRIHVINSKTLSGSFGLFVLELAEMIEHGRKIDEIVKEAEQLIKKTEILVSVPSLEFMVKGGRVHPVLGRIGSAINMKPVVSVDGEGRSLLYGKTVFRKSNVNTLLKQIKAIHKRHTIDKYVLLHAHGEQWLPTLEKEMTAITGEAPFYTTSVSPVIGMHAGKGAVSVAMILKEENKRGEK